MHDIAGIFTENDLKILVKLLIPGCKDRDKMVKTIRDDEDILKGMISDDKLFSYLVDDPDSIIRISPQLFFTVLIYRVFNDLSQSTYTTEQQNRHKIFVFDTKEVVDLLKDKKILGYLAGMLTSFVRINSITIPVRVKKGIWRKVKFSDFDIDSLIKYSQIIDETQRFGTYKRIADICLFIMGIFPEYLSSQNRSYNERNPSFGSIMKKNRESYSEQGSYFYRIAAQQKSAEIFKLNQVLMQLSEKFTLAAKPLSYLSTHYLGFFKEQLFLQ
jgi:hypothetical protein